MLFLFSTVNPRSFWMKNTLIPLDMIWVNENKEIIGISKDVLPCKADPCPSYSSFGPVKYVLEVNAGFSDRKSLKIGDKLEFLN